MPKDATKNIDRYKIRGGQLNEFDFHQNQEEFAEQQTARAANLIPGTPPEAKKPVKSTKTKTKTAVATKATKSTNKATKGTKSKATKGTKSRKASKARKAPVGATAKKLAARKAAKKK